MLNYPRIDASVPAYDDFDLPRQGVDGWFAKNEGLGPAMPLASAPPIRKANENISNGAEAASVFLNPYTFTSLSKLKGADLYKSAVTSDTKSISPPNSRPL